MRKMLVFVMFIALSLPDVMAQPCKTVIGYYPNWQWYDRNGLVAPSTIQYEDYSIINYSFFAPQEDGSVAVTDPWADKNLLLGQINWSVAPAGYDTEWNYGNAAYHYTNTSLISHAHNAGTQVLICIGGWTLSNLFPAIASDPTKRTQFAHSCCDIVRTFSCDGIDIDWEYPGFAEHNGTPQDGENYALLITELRDSLDQLEQLSGSELLLTAACGASATHMQNVDWNVMVDKLDYINLMTYDYSGTWDSMTNHHTPLFPDPNGMAENCVSWSVSHLMDVYNVPSTKINIGVAYYGKSIVTTGSPDLHVTSAGYADGVTFSADEGTPLYYNILNHLDEFEYHWDNDAHAPYLTGTNGLNTFVTYDDVNSTTDKANFILEHNLAGAIIWEITGDYVESQPGSGIIGSTPLSDALNETLCQSVAVDLDCENICVTSIAMNPEGGLLDVTIANGNAQINYPVVMVVLNGDTVANENGEFIFFAQLPGQTVTHTISTTLTEVPNNFTCEVILYDALYDEACVLDYPCITNGIAEMSKEFTVFPIPTQNELHVLSDKIIAHATIYDAMGRMIMQRSVWDMSCVLDVSSLNPGIYFVDCEESLGEHTIFRFVVE